MKVSLVASWVVFGYLCGFALVSAFLAFVRFGDGRWEEGVWSLVSSVLWGSGALLWLTLLFVTTGLTPTPLRCAGPPIMVRLGKSSWISLMPWWMPTLLKS
jgi:hypothetical protein